jgi:hypothetical protein
VLSVIYAAPTIHHEAIDWATRVSANGGTISTTVLRAVSDFCAAIDAASLRSSMRRVNLFCGGNLSGCLVPLYRATSSGGSVLGNDTDTNANFVSADFQETGASGGLKGNGTSKYLNTGFTPALFASTDSVHLSYSATSLETAHTNNPCAIGTYDGTDPTLYDLSVSFNILGGNSRCARLSTQSGIVRVSAITRGSTESHLIGTRTASNAAALYGDGVSLATSTTSVTSGTSTRPFYVFAENSSGTTTAFTSGRLRMYSIGSGLTATQAAAFSNAVAAFNATLGR